MTQRIAKYVGRRRERIFPYESRTAHEVHDYLGYGYLAGQVVHGFSGCVRCMDDTTYRQLDRDPGSSIRGTPQRKNISL